MSVKKIVVDTDILLEHLTHGEGASSLRTLMNAYFCYTTVFNAIEVFSVAQTVREIQAVDDAMSTMKVLGLNARSAKTIGRVLSSVAPRRTSALSVLIGGVCVESRLPIVTMNPKRFSRIKELRVIPAQKLVRAATASAMLSH